MSPIPYGDWAIECVLVNETTVMNNDGIRALEISEHEWVLQPSGQRFKVLHLTSKSAVLESQGETFHAYFEIRANHLSLQMSRASVKETLRIEAEAISADVFVNLI